VRIGHGVDAHRLEAGRPLMLGGVAVPHDRGLEGHSDGDVVVHALANALLGGAGAGDIGQHFPSSDEHWRGASGAALLARVATIVAEAGFRIESAQVVAIAEEPRLSPHLAAMAAAMSEALGLPRDVLSVSATSTDGLGFAGRGEGMAASAVALLASLS
jgi:2-C-methyl-D-erythritol 2,4-cyclodiphosphate synthase